MFKNDNCSDPPHFTVRRKDTRTEMYFYFVGLVEFAVRFARLAGPDSLTSVGNGESFPRFGVGLLFV